MATAKTCSRCGKTFSARTNNQEYCSAHCRSAAYNDRRRYQTIYKGIKINFNHPHNGDWSAELGAGHNPFHVNTANWPTHDTSFEKVLGRAKMLIDLDDPLNKKGNQKPLF
jgi:outer membrane protein assembly factor BamA